MGKEQGINTFRRLIWLLDIIHRAGDKGISRREISERWQANAGLSGGEAYALRTFRNHIDHDIPQIFDIDIECTKAHGYRVKYPDDMKRDTLIAWIISIMSLKNTIAGNARLRDRVLFEPVPAGEHLLHPIMDAIKDAATVEIAYQRFHEDKPSAYLIDPYFLKLSRRRWYLVGRCHEMKRIYTFSLDRLQDLKRAGERFTMPEINGADFFANSFGIIWSANDKPAIVKIRVYGEQASYTRSLPLHASQKEITGTRATPGDHADFEYRVLITHDFIQELLSHGETLEVLEPARLRQEMKRHATAMRKYYR
jgi:hypothetical protein